MPCLLDSIGSPSFYGISSAMYQTGICLYSDGTAWEKSAGATIRCLIVVPELLVLGKLCPIWVNFLLQPVIWTVWGAGILQAGHPMWAMWSQTTFSWTHHHYHANIFFMEQHLPWRCQCKVAPLLLIRMFCHATWPTCHMTPWSESYPNTIQVKADGNQMSRGSWQCKIQSHTSSATRCPIS